MEATAKTRASLSLPWKTRFLLWAFSTVSHAARRRDGTVNRRLLKFLEFRTPPTSKPVNGVKTYDIEIDPNRELWFRVFVPTQQAVEDLAVIHRYPVQHNDCFDVLKFLDDEENRPKSLPENANISRCFIAGDSAGGNIAHHVAQRACEFKFKQLKVIGLVAIQPFFGGEERTNSEKELEGAPVLSLEHTDWNWNALMPPGEGYNRDHPIINVSGPQAVDISKMEFPATIVVVGGFDLLRDWQKRYYEWLKRSGKDAYLVEYPNMCHGFYAFPELPESEQLISEVKDFIHKKNIHLLWRRTTNPACRMMCDRVNKYQHKRPPSCASAMLSFSPFSSPVELDMISLRLLPPHLELNPVSQMIHKLSSKSTENNKIQT
ncbi:hypothetical protein L1987_21064 [Smallanthus sonchifolius]|uniref:Uncharacterized protein n=1 Tax=Smallanthus sonchifolius TaxID=185202 RepID=A0ACB9ISY4_9ASTR|nr:hypothetical protein L1987_21064 [Smallanthus sonchifolius]